MKEKKIKLVLLAAISALGLVYFTSRAQLESENDAIAMAGDNYMLVEGQYDGNTMGGDRIEGNAIIVAAENPVAIADRGDSKAMSGDRKGIEEEFENVAVTTGNDAINKIGNAGIVVNRNPGKTGHQTGLEAVSGSRIAVGEVRIRVEADEGGINDGEIKTIKIDSERSSAAGGLVKIGSMAVNEGILKATVANSHFSSLAFVPGSPDAMANVNVRFAGIAQAAQNSGIQSILQQNVSVQGNLNFAAVPLAIGVTVPSEL